MGSISCAKKECFYWVSGTCHRLGVISSEGCPPYRFKLSQPVPTDRLPVSDDEQAKVAGGKG